MSAIEANARKSADSGEAYEGRYQLWGALTDVLRWTFVVATVELDANRLVQSVKFETSGLLNCMKMHSTYELDTDARLMLEHLCTLIASDFCDKPEKVILCCTNRVAMFCCVALFKLFGVTGPGLQGGACKVFLGSGGACKQKLWITKRVVHDKGPTGRERSSN